MKIIGKEVEIVFLVILVGVLVELIFKLVVEGLKVIDLFGDFCMIDFLLYELWYKRLVVKEEIFRKVVYGLSEWKRIEI